jgi:predicted phage terminase large subunit-like protein
MNQSVTRQTRAQIELLKRAAWDDLYVFTKYVVGKDALEEQPHREVCEFLQAGLEVNKLLKLDLKKPVYSTKFVQECQKKLKKLLMLPRGSFKSTIASTAFPIWLLWHNTDLRILIDCATLQNSKSYLSAIKDIITNNTLVRAICTDENDEFVLDPNYKISGGFTEDQIILKSRKKIGLKEPSIFLTAVDNTKTGFHPDIIIMDDLVSEKTVETEGQIEKTKDHYRFSLSLLEPGGLQVVIGTRYHMNDLYAELLEMDNFDKLVRPAILEDGSLYFPTRLNHEYLEEQKISQGSYIFSSQYMLNPIDDSNAVFKKDWLKYYTNYPSITEIHILVDLAISERETADYTVVTAVGITSDKKIYVLDYDRGHYQPKHTIESIFAMYEKWRTVAHIKTVGVETVAYQKAMIYLLQDECKRRAVYMPIKELKADRDKLRRVQALQPLFERGEVFIKAEHIDLEREILEFPYSKHDDTVDCLAYILQVLRAGILNSKNRKEPEVVRNSFTNY